MSLRKLFAMLIALSVLLAPSVAFAGMPMSARHDMTMMEMGHCDAPPAKADGKGPVKNCCISMCMAVATAPEAPAAIIDVPHAGAYFVVPLSWRAFLGEIATPPPRTA